MWKKCFYMEVTDVAGFEPAITDLEGRCLIQARPHAQRR